MTTPDPDLTICIRCSRVEDLPDTGDNTSKQYNCEECGRLVWVACEMEDVIAQRYPGAAVVAVCMQCGPPPDENEVVNLPEHVAFLRAHGDNDFMIIYKLAIAAVASGAASYEAVEHDIIANPDGARARALPEAIRKAALLVAATYLPSN